MGQPPETNNQLWDGDGELDFAHTKVDQVHVLVNKCMI